jgi:cobalt-zinc-cadmium efflux system membrane fusion protein
MLPSSLSLSLNLSLSLLLVGGLLASSGCDSATEEATGAKPAAKERVPGVVRLTEEEVQRAGIVTEQVLRGEFRTSRDFPGTVGPNQRAVAEITTLVRGRVVDVYADLGQEVQGGSLLAILYSSELGMAQSAYLKANAKLYVAERAYNRAKSLLEEKVIGVAEAQRREGDMISARAEAREAKDRVQLLGMGEDAIRRLGRDQKILSYVPIEAPFEGRVITRNITKGEVVETTEKLFTVADLSEVWVLANIPEKDIPYIPRESTPQAQRVEVRVTAYSEEPFYGRITYVGDVLNAATRTMNLRIEVPNPARKLKPEMYATIRIYSDTEHDVLVLPEAAIQREREKTFVFVQRDPQAFEVREVSIGPSNGAVVKVLDGLREGETVVTHGAFILKSEVFSEQA